jgi:hypothetical protein
MSQGDRHICWVVNSTKFDATRQVSTTNSLAFTGVIETAELFNSILASSVLFQMAHPTLAKNTKVVKMNGKADYISVDIGTINVARPQFVWQRVPGVGSCRLGSDSNVGPSGSNAETGPYTIATCQTKCAKDSACVAITYYMNAKTCEYFCSSLQSPLCDVAGDRDDAQNPLFTTDFWKTLPHYDTTNPGSSEGVCYTKMYHKNAANEPSTKSNVAPSFDNTAYELYVKKCNSVGCSDETRVNTRAKQISPAELNISPKKNPSSWIRSDHQKIKYSEHCNKAL